MTAALCVKCQDDSSAKRIPVSQQECIIVVSDALAWEHTSTKVKVDSYYQRLISFYRYFVL